MEQATSVSCRKEKGRAVSSWSWGESEPSRDRVSSSWSHAWMWGWMSACWRVVMRILLKRVH